MHQEILQKRDKLQRLFEQAEELQKIDAVDGETKSGFVSYLCVRTSGYVESSVKTILKEYVKSKASNTAPYIANFVNRQLDSTFNPRRSEVLRLVGQFNLEWKENLKVSINNELGDSLRSIAINRNNIAHGVDVDLSLKDLRKWFADAQKVVERVYSECN